MRALRSSLCLLLAGAALSACDSSTPDVAQTTVLYVGNQGNFSDNNGSLTAYDVETGTATPGAAGDLGGLVQSFFATGERLYVLLNFDDSFTTGRGRIDVIDAATGERVDQVDARTPRGLAPRVETSQGTFEAYVSNLYDGTVTPVNLVSGMARTPIPVGDNPEGIVRVGSRVYVANSGFGSGTSVSVIDAASDAVTATLEDVCAGPRTLLADAERDVWVICTGTTDFTTGAVTPGAVVVLDGATGAEVARYEAGGLLGSATFGQDGAYADGEVYVLAGDTVLRFDAGINALAARISVPGAPLGAVAYDPAAGRLYLGRPDASNPYGADGVVTIHDRAGAEVGRFTAGVAPAVLAFVVRETPVEA